MKPTRERFHDAVIAMSEVIPFFPQKGLAIDIILEAIRDFIATEEQLDWFVRAAVRKLRKYEGVPHLRQLFCTRYAPADGIQPTFATSEEFLAHEAQMEAQYRQKEIEENEKRFETYKRQAQLAPPEDRELFLLPEPQTIPGDISTSVVHIPQQAESLKEVMSIRKLMSEAEVAALPKTPVRSEEERQQAIRELEEALRNLPPKS